MPKLAWF